MSDTPETDAYKATNDHSTYGWSEFARKLERERDEAVRACHIWQDGHSKIVGDRNYWKAEAERWREIKK